MIQDCHSPDVQVLELEEAGLIQEVALLQIHNHGESKGPGS